MGGKDLGFDVVLRGQTRDHIKPGIYVFFQRERELGGGFWFGQAFDDWFSFVVEEPVSLNYGMQYLISIRGNQEGIMNFDDSLDNFMLKG